MGATTSKNSAYPLPIPGYPVYDRPQSSWSVFGKGKKDKGRFKNQTYYTSNPYSYVPQPYPYYPGQTFTSTYYPQAGVVPQVAVTQAAPVIQPTMQMPVPNVAPAQQQGQAFDPVSVRPPPVPMPEPPQGGPIPPPPQMQSQPQTQTQPMPQPVIPPSPTFQDISGPPRSSANRTSIKNPLPTPPKDIYEMSPYRSLLRDLPVTSSILAGQGGLLSGPDSGRGGLGSLLGSLAGRDKKLRKRSASTSSTLPSLVALANGPLQRSHTVTSFVAHPVPPPALPQANGFGVANGISASTYAPPAGSDPSRSPPVRFDHQSPLAGFMNHSSHRVLYQNTVYSTALHLLEALKFLPHRPDLVERIRAVQDVREVYPLTSTFQDFVRGDWSQIFMEMVEEVLYLKFKQHPDLRSLLLNTSTADIIYSDPGDSYWGEGLLGQGANEFGKAIMRVRERLRREGYSVGPPSNSGPPNGR